MSYSRNSPARLDRFGNLKAGNTLPEYLLALLILVPIAGFRLFGIDHDYAVYNRIFQFDLNKILHANVLFEIEPGFFLVCALTRIISNSFAFFVFFMAAISISLKLLAFRRFEVYWGRDLFLYVIIYYFAHYFLLHEMTQIRVGIAGGFFLLSLRSLLDRRFRTYFLFFLAAFLFHYTSIVMLPIYLLNTRKVRSLFYVLPALGIALHGRSLLLLTNSAVQWLLNSVLPGVGFKVSKYVDLVQQGVNSDINVFNLVYLSLVGFFYLTLVLSGSPRSKAEILFIKILSVCLFSFYFFSDVPVLAFRIAEFLGLVNLFLVPIVFRKVRPIEVGFIIFMAYCAGIFYNDLFRQRLFGIGS